MADYTPDEAAGILRRLASLLERDQPRLAKDYAEDVRTLAMRNAAGRPSPQAAAVGRELELRESRDGAARSIPAPRASWPSAGTRPSSPADRSEWGT